MTDIIVTPPTPQIIVNRRWFSDKSTIGDYLVQKELVCNSLEDSVRRIKVYGQTAIPSGLYRTVLVDNEHYGFTMMLLDVPYFTGIFVHSGNRDADTKGCVIVGTYDESVPDWVSGSVAAHAKLMPIVKAIADKEKLWTEIVGGLSAAEMRAA